MGVCTLAVVVLAEESQGCRAELNDGSDGVGIVGQERLGSVVETLFRKTRPKSSMSLDEVTVSDQSRLVITPDDNKGNVYEYLDKVN